MRYLIQEGLAASLGGRLLPALSTDETRSDMVHAAVAADDIQRDISVQVWISSLYSLRTCVSVISMIIVVVICVIIDMIARGHVPSRGRFRFAA